MWCLISILAMNLSNEVTRVILMPSVSPRHAHYRHTKRKIHPLQPPTLSAEDAAQHPIQRRNIDVALRRGAQTGQAHQDPTQKRWHEERYVRITRALDIEARSLDRPSQLGQTVTPPMVTHVVLYSPQPHERRHNHHHATARTQHAAHLPQARHIIIE